MNKLSIFLSALAIIGTMVSCKEEHVKMPWEDDLNKKHEEQGGELPDVQVGQVMPRWVEGCLDIHAINSGRGESIFYILPDGTTLLIDAGETTTSSQSVPQKPNAETRPYLTDANYIKHFLPAGKKAFDYFMASHFHIDHIGAPAMATATSENGYKLAGITALYEEVPFNHLIDRAYPSYKEDTSIPTIDSGFADDYITFVKWGTSNKKFDGARFEVGKKDQIKLLNDPDKYKNFSILNICGNGNAWVLDETVADGGRVQNYSSTGGNPASCGIHMRYGKFDYVACGDLVSSPQNAVANYVKAAIPANGFEVFKAHHHLSANSWGSGMQKNSFSPRVIINQNFSDYQPDYGLVSSIDSGVFANNTYTWEKNFLTTNLHPNQEATYPDIASKLAGYNGHIVIRVSPGGESYNVYMLDDTNMIYRVKAIYGPYDCK